MTRGKVARFAETGRIEEAFEFTLQKLIYALAVSNRAEAIAADFQNERITIFVPRALARDWTRGDAIKITGEQVLSENKYLRILIEKDFVCLSGRKGEDESDNFPHPTNRCC